MNYGKKTLKYVGEMTITGVGLGIGADLANDAGSPEAASALGKLGKAMPVVGGLRATGLLLDEAKKLNKRLR